MIAIFKMQASYSRVLGAQVCGSEEAAGSPKLRRCVQSVFTRIRLLRCFPEGDELAQSTGETVAQHAQLTWNTGSHQFCKPELFGRGATQSRMQLVGFPRYPRV